MSRVAPDIGSNPGPGSGLAVRLSLPQIFLYPERLSPTETDWTRLVGSLEAAWRTRVSRTRVRRLTPIIHLVERLGTAMSQLDDDALVQASREAGRGLRQNSDWQPMLIAPAFAAIREAATRRLGLRPHDQQLLGGYALLCGMVAEMGTGEGKTLTAGLAAATAALGGLPVHVVTVNAYLAERDAETMGKLYRSLGLSVGVVTELMPAEHRPSAYRCDITYCTNKILAFDYMRDRLQSGRRLGNLRRKAAQFSGHETAAATRLRGLCFAIIDEADSVLIDEARTPLILSGGGEVTRDAAVFDHALSLAAQLRQGLDFTIVESERRVLLTEACRVRLEELESLGPPWDELAERERLVVQALTALHLMKRDEHYLVRDGSAEIIDEFTGRILPDRMWSDGLHELIERKEGLDLSERRLTFARMTYQRFFRRYQRLAGMTGTGHEIATELFQVYRLKLATIPPHRPSRRVIKPLVGHRTSAAKWQAIIAEVRSIHQTGAPVLIGTRTLGESERASALLQEAGIPHHVLNAAQDAREAEIVAAAGQYGAVTVATNMAGRGTDIRPAPEAIVLGGLHVIMSEMHEAARIDRQLAGRCARQGEPGEVRMHVALDDALVVRFCPNWLRDLAALLATSTGGATICIAARYAQWRAEQLHARMRRDLLKADQWIGDAIAFAGDQE